MFPIAHAARLAGIVGLLAAMPPAIAQAPAQRPAAPAPAAPADTGIKVPLKAAPEQPEWLKVCGEDPAIKKTLCYTTRDFVAENNQPVMAVAVYEVKADSRRFARFLVPLSFMIQPGIRFSAQGLPPTAAKFQICLMEGCFVEGELTEAAINAMKKTETLRIDMQNQIGQEVNFQVPLTGFGKAFDSKGIDQETLQKMREQQARGGQPPQGAAPPAAGQGADDLKKKAEELLRQRQNAPKQ